MLYPELFKQLEAVRWNMDHDIPWADFDATRLSDEQIEAALARLAMPGNRKLKALYARVRDKFVERPRPDIPS